MGVFGIGALGRHHTRILSTFEGVTLEGIFDTRPEVAAAVAAEHGATVASSFDELAGKIDAAVLAAPTTLHGELGLRAPRARRAPPGGEADRLDASRRRTP